MNNKKLSRTPLLDNEACVKNAGGNRFEMVIMAAVRAREIVKANKSWGETRHINATMEALLDLQDGKVTKDYLKRVK